MLDLTEHHLVKNIDAFLDKIMPAIESYCNQNSGWILESIEGLSVTLVCGRNDSGGAPSFTTPPSLAKVRWCPNLRGIDGECFPDAIRYCLAHAEGLTEKQAFRYINKVRALLSHCLLYTSPSPRDLSTSRMPSSA